MKTVHDPRHKLRQDTVKMLFAQSFTDQPNLNELANKVSAKTKDLDITIQKAAPTWPIDKLNRIDLAILRLAVFELQEEKAPPKVIIDEAVELAKEYGGENSPSFVNGVLGTIYKDQNK